MGCTTIVRSGLPGSGRRLPGPPGRDEVRHQLALILASPLFRNSRHYPALLRHIVEETLEGRQGHLKERSLGVDVFGREPNYDTNLDPVVRTSACEVRKRLAQFYNEHRGETLVQIDLPHGCYVPEFRYREAAAEPEAITTAAPPEAEPAPQGPWRLAWRRYRTAVLVAAVALLGLAALSSGMRRSAVERFWSPVWGASDSVMVCLGVGARPAYADPDSGPTISQVMNRDSVAFSDAITMARITALLQENRKRFDVRKETAFTLNDFRRGPVVLIGAFNNLWTLRLENHLRFVFENDPIAQHTLFIRDRQNPSRVSWRSDTSTPYAKLPADYAIISRFVDPRTEKTVVVVAGITKDGTMAAGEFVTGERYLNALSRQAPSGWEHKNLQVVISTEIMNGIPAPPRILATYFW